MARPLRIEFAGALYHVNLNRVYIETSNRRHSRSGRLSQGRLSLGVEPIRRSQFGTGRDGAVTKHEALE